MGSVCSAVAKRNHNMIRLLVSALLLGSALGQTIDQSCKCGQKTVNRIVGGEQAQVNEWPWQAALMLGSNGPFCGGSLISDRYVLTAAHCTEGLRANDLNVRLGEHKISSSSESQTVTRRVSKIINHENYQGGSEINDIALLQLSSPVEFRSEVWPVCLPPSTPSYANKVATVTGWGTTSSGGSVSDVLREVDVKVKGYSDCQSSYGSSNIKETMLCAGAPGKNYDQIGVVSWGYGCANPSYPGVYTRVSKYLSWIKENTQDATYCRGFVWP